MNQNYHNLDNIQTTSTKSRKLTKVALLSLLIVGLFGAVVYFSESGSNSLIVPNMLYMDANNNNVVISTSRNMTVCSSQGGDGIPLNHQQCTVYQSVQDIIAQNNGSNDLVNVFIIYKDLNSTTEFDPSGNVIPNESDFQPLLNDEMDLIFKATLSMDGTLLGLYAPKGYDYSELVIRMTERLIEQYFPQLSASLFPSNNMFKLSAPPAHIENNYLGTVTPQFSYSVIDESHYMIKKAYSDKDFVHFHYSLGGDMPDIEYQSNYVIKDGMVEINNEVLTFNINSESQNLRSGQSNSIPINQNNSTEYVEIIGQTNSKIESTLQILGSSQNPELVAEVLAYESNQGFVQVDLTDHSGKIEILKGGEESSVLLSEAEPFISKSYDVFRHSIVGNKVSLTIDYKNFESYSEISSGIYLNDQSIYTIYKTSIQHPWFACAGYEKGDNRSQKLKVFEVVYPLLGGILNIPISAYISVEYGWNFTVGASGANCNIEFKPYVNPAFEVTGAVSVWKVAEGGVYARGSVANSYIDFLLQIDRKALQLLFTVDAKLIPFQYRIGAYYQYINCSVKKIIQNIFKFKWGEVCSMSDKTEIPLLDGQLLQTLSYRLHEETKPLLSV